MLGTSRQEVGSHQIISTDRILRETMPAIGPHLYCWHFERMRGPGVGTNVVDIPLSGIIDSFPTAFQKSELVKQTHLSAHRRSLKRPIRIVSKGVRRPTAGQIPH